MSTRCDPDSTRDVYTDNSVGRANYTAYDYIGNPLQGGATTESSERMGEITLLTSKNKAVVRRAFVFLF
jgi:hypothetical protein